MGYEITENQVAEVTMKGTLDGQSIINRFDYFSEPGLVPTALSDDFAAAFNARWVAAVIPVLSSQYRMVGCTVKRIIQMAFHPTIPTQVVRLYSPAFSEASAADFGDIVGDTLPAYVTVTGRKITGLLGRGNRGSTRFSGVVEADTVAGGNTLEAAAVTAWQAAMTALVAPIGLPLLASFQMRMGVINSALAIGAGGDELSIWQSTHQVTGMTCNTVVGSQLSRKKARV